MCITNLVSTHTFISVNINMHTVTYIHASYVYNSAILLISRSTLLYYFSINANTLAVDLVINHFEVVSSVLGAT